MTEAKRALSEQNKKRVQKFKDNAIKYHLFGGDSYRIDFKDGSSIYVNFLKHQDPIIQVNGFSDSTGQECADLLRRGIVDVSLVIEELIQASGKAGYISPNMRK